MARKTLISALAGLLLASSIVEPAHAAMAVIDVKGIGEMQKQLANMKEQLGTLKSQLDTAKESLSVVTDQLKVVQDVKGIADETLSSIGELGNLSIPSLNFQSLASSVSGDMACLIPDYHRLMPSIKFDEVDFGSICERGNAYKSGLVATPQSLTAGTWEEKANVQKSVHENRIATITDATVKGLAQSDEAHETAVKTLETAQEYKSAGEGAQTVNARLQVLIELEVAQLVATAQTNQILAQMLKIQASDALNNGVPVMSEIAEERKYNEEGAE
ncbi:hypothetical protein [Labrenzia sp. 011]|uniref:hypothetical protein n=1 Tax=Labrenzia sp. 011 TaxID=2171494 RepID=UPI000D510D4E|nr:hypothetical protein [Labrenzia sp. 011]PVB60381.1 hypothetical protein DCO57_17305 [Labrenzia sp. 011]